MLGVIWLKRQLYSMQLLYPHVGIRAESKLQYFFWMLATLGTGRGTKHECCEGGVVQCVGMREVVVLFFVREVSVCLLRTVYLCN